MPDEAKSRHWLSCAQQLSGMPGPRLTRSEADLCGGTGSADRDVPIIHMIINTILGKQGNLILYTGDFWCGLSGTGRVWCKVWDCLMPCSTETGRTMREAQRKQAEELVRQMGEAHDQIKKYMEQGSSLLAMALLEECQNGGITVGTLIEKTEGEGHPTVLLLEGYCELAYRIHEDLAGQGEMNANKAHKVLRQKLTKVENSIRNDIRIRTEVVFLPYKASMWDSLESVWMAADADENCDAYVIPLPYFDKNPDGSFREMHYEGDQYPEYVPVTKYDAYDFAARRPDAIYIHSAYDDWNLVTSVHPFFYSGHLKKFTDMLVYIPYFVLEEIKPCNNAMIENMKHFCTLPGVFKADKVIVQSEDMRQVYIKVLMNAANDHSEAVEKYWTDKVMGLGSPKLDRLADIKREDILIPDEWMEIIRKPDGSRKKVIFYNTSIAGLLQYNEQALEKMEHVFRVFKENQDTAALLWRPHPLVKATVESMRPQLWTKYDKLVADYRKGRWGIYDDTADLNRAIEISDAYYGDGSSIVHLYQQTGKPVMIQNVNVLNEIRNV